MPPTKYVHKSTSSDVRQHSPPPKFSKGDVVKVNWAGYWIQGTILRGQWVPMGGWQYSVCNDPRTHLEADLKLVRKEVEQPPRQPKFSKDDQVQVDYDGEWLPAKIQKRRVTKEGWLYTVFYPADKTTQTQVKEHLIKRMPDKPKRKPAVAAAQPQEGATALPRSGNGTSLEGDRSSKRRRVSEEDPSTNAVPMSNKRRRRESEEDISKEEDGHAPGVVVASSDPNATAAAVTVDLISREKWKPIPEILLVKMQAEDAQKVADALDKLFNMIGPGHDKYGKNREEAFRLGAPALVVLAMKKFQHDVQVQDNGCYCLLRLSVDGEYAHTIAEVGGMEAVFNALKTFPDAEQMQSGGLCTLANLFEHIHCAETLSFCRRFVKEMDGVGVIVTAMKKFHESQEIVCRCCDALGCLAKKKEFRDKMKAAGAVGAVGRAIDEHSRYLHKRRAKEFMELMLT